MTNTSETFAERLAPAAWAASTGVSIELAPEQVRNFAPRVEQFPHGSRVFLTHLTGKPEAMQVEAALRIREMGYTAVPHFGARNFKTEKDFIDLVTAHSRNGITEALFLGGNPPLFAGPMGQSSQLLSHPVLKDSTIGTAFVAGYPEGHPAISETDLSDALQRKIEICEARSLDVRVASQFAFDGEMIAAWAKKLHAQHPDLPIHVGLAGVTSLTKLIRFSMMCGVGPSIAALRRSASGLFNIIADRNPADIVDAMVAAYPDPAAHMQLHFFPFGGWEKTLSWFDGYREVRGGRAGRT